jgi:hypothetical protein
VTVGQAAEAGLEGIAAEPIAPLAAPVASFDRTVRLVDDQPADPVHLRFARESLRLPDGHPLCSQPVVGDELRGDRRDHYWIASGPCWNRRQEKEGISHVGRRERKGGERTK